MERIRIHGTFDDVDRHAARAATTGREYEHSPDSSRIIGVTEPRQAAMALNWGCQYAHVERSFGSSRLAPFHKLSPEQVRHGVSEYEIALRARYGFTPANLLIHMPSEMWHWRIGRRYRRNMLIALGQLGAYRLFFVIDKKKPSRGQKFWHELGTLGTMIFNGPLKNDQAHRHGEKLHERCQKYDIDKYGLEFWSLTFNGHFDWQHKLGVSLILTGHR